MRIFKGQKTKPKNKIRNFYIMRYLGISLILLSIPFLPYEVPEFHSFFKSRYWLIADILLLWSVGAMFEKSLFQAIIQDAEEKKAGGDALNASSLLFFATPTLFLFTCAALVHLYAMWYFWSGHTLPDMAARLQCAALAVGLVFCIYGRFLPAFSFNSRWGFKTKKSTSSPEAWKAFHKEAGKRLMIGGFILILPCLFLSGAAALAVAGVLGIAVLGSCYFM